MVLLDWLRASQLTCSSAKFSCGQVGKQFWIWHKHNEEFIYSTPNKLLIQWEVKSPKKYFICTTKSSGKQDRALSRSSPVVLASSPLISSFSFLLPSFSSKVEEFDQGGLHCLWDSWRRGPSQHWIICPFVTYWLTSVCLCLVFLMELSVSVSLPCMLMGTPSFDDDALMLVHELFLRKLRANDEWLDSRVEVEPMGVIRGGGAWWAKMASRAVLLVPECSKQGCVPASGELRAPSDLRLSSMRAGLRSLVWAGLLSSLLR
jgi:hypothetical protein